ncbi:hypothetical protein MMC21_006010 [Puttea exsequens]|nr:hypothetical protein [Puttea exsequens]
MQACKESDHIPKQSIEQSAEASEVETVVKPHLGPAEMACYDCLISIQAQLKKFFASKNGSVWIFRHELPLFATMKDVLEELNGLDGVNNVQGLHDIIQNDNIAVGLILEAYELSPESGGVGDSKAYDDETGEPVHPLPCDADDIRALLMLCWGLGHDEPLRVGLVSYGHQERYWRPQSVQHEDAD